MTKSRTDQCRTFPVPEVNTADTYAAVASDGARLRGARRRVGLASVITGLTLVVALMAPGLASASELAAVTAMDRPGVEVRSVVNLPQARVVDPQPRNGAVLLKRGSGRGELAVDNSRNDSDTVVTLARSGRAVLVVYVHAGSRTRASSVPDGMFDVYAERGRHWDRRAGRFAESATSARLDRPAEFRTQSTGRSVRYSKVSLTLYGVVGGNTQLQPVAESAVPS